jgi:hypothetical protein
LCISDSKVSMDLGQCYNSVQLRMAMIIDFFPFSGKENPIKQFLKGQHFPTAGIRGGGRLSCQCIATRIRGLQRRQP